MHLVVELEKQFGVQFDDEEVVEMISPAAIAAILARRGVRG